MKTYASPHTKIQKMVTVGILIALTIALQIVSNFIRFGPISITLALTPVIIGAALYGPKTGTLIGFVLGVVIFFSGLGGLDGGFVVAMMEYNGVFSAIATTILCIGKSTVAGFVAGLLYNLLAKKSKTLGCAVASIATPIINTGIFALGMMTIFFGFLTGNFSADNPIGFLFLSMIGVNFLVELLVNAALGTVLARVIDYYNLHVRRS